MLYVQIGQTLLEGGPASLFLAFTIWSVLPFSVLSFVLIYVLVHGLVLAIRMYMNEASGHQFPIANVHNHIPEIDSLLYSDYRCSVILCLTVCTDPFPSLDIPTQHRDPFQKRRLIALMSIPMRLYQY